MNIDVLPRKHTFDSGTMKCVNCGADYFKVYRDSPEYCPVHARTPQGSEEANG